MSDHKPLYDLVLATGGMVSTQTCRYITTMHGVDIYEDMRCGFGDRVRQAWLILANRNSTDSCGVVFLTPDGVANRPWMVIDKIGAKKFDQIVMVLKLTLVWTN